MRKFRWLLYTALAACMLTGCGAEAAYSDGEALEEWLLGKAGETVNRFSEAYGEDILNALDSLKNAEHPGGPFENNIESARAYLLGQLREKYGMEFMVTGRENLTNYGLIAGASYSCEAAPVDAPEQTTMALVSQTAYQDVRDGYAVYFFKEAAEAPVLSLCGEKDYVLDQRVSLELPVTPKIWTPEDALDRFLSESGAYVKTVLRFADGLDAETYAGYLYDFLHSADGLHCNLLLQAKANKAYIFHQELAILGDSDARAWTMERLTERVEEDMRLYTELS